MRLENRGRRDAEDRLDPPIREQRQHIREVRAVVIRRRFRRHAVCRIARHAEAEIVSLELRVGLIRRERFAVLVARLAAHAVRHAGRRHEIALVAAVDEHARGDRMIIAGGIRKERDLDRAHPPWRIALGVAARFDAVERPVRLHRDPRLRGEQLFENCEVHLRLRLRPVQRILHLRRIRAECLAIMRLDRLREFSERARQSFERPEIRMRQPIRHHAADVRSRLDQQHPLAILGRRECRRDAARRRAVHDHIELLRAQHRAKTAKGRNEKSAHLPRLMAHRALRKPFVRERAAEIL